MSERTQPAFGEDLNASTNSRDEHLAASNDEPPVCEKCGERHYGRTHPWSAIKRKRDEPSAANVREYQTCPKCGGQGHVNKPPYVAGDQESWVAGNTGGWTCPVCNGAKLVVRP